mmetsp:Transcript_14657/g.16265  ORF Transcript_14657/g.16265 Transcript_14657/m.16265 type:complete len:533 (+) Transcript_14657:62-1660(+)
MRIILILLTLAVLSIYAQKPPKPHVVFLLIDDYGWANVGYHRDPPTEEVQTPNIDALVAEGIELDRHYVFKYCSPTRSAIQSGRNPIHVNVLNIPPTYYNASDPVSGFQGIPRNMTGIAEKMKSAGYATHMAGKWDAGMATPDHSPLGRGYQTSLHYFHHENDYWTYYVARCSQENIVDLWHTDEPAKSLTNPKTCSQENQASDCVYEDELFEQYVFDVLDNHDPSTPLFLFWAPHSIHTPLEVPKEYVDKFSFIDNKSRRMYHAMVNFIDSRIGMIVNKLKEKGMYEDTLIVMSADNGGPIYGNGTSGGNNWPLRGGKVSNFEGGVRVNAFASGGLIPKERRGTKEEGYICGWDWYATFCAIAGVDPTDEKAAKAKLPPIDSLNMWPLLSGQTKTSPRNIIPLGSPDPPEERMSVVPTIVNGIIVGEWKLLVGNISQDSWTGPRYPNVTTNWESTAHHLSCGTGGCLFNIKNDPTEHVNLASQEPTILAELHTHLKTAQASVFSPHRGTISPKACEDAINKYNGYWGPFVE